LQEGVVILNREKQIVSMNQAFKTMFSLTEESKNKSFLECVRSEKLNGLAEKAIQGASPMEEEIEWTQPQEKYLLVFAFALNAPETGASAALIFFDKTQVRHLEQLRRDFVANVSHEIKTPLTSIQGFIETLLSGAVNDEAKAKRFLNLMEEDAKRLKRLLDDLLKLSDIESKVRLPEKTKLQLGEEINRVVELLSIQINEKKIKVENTVPASVEVFADPDQLRQILLNLLDNAIKFNHTNGNIKIRAKSNPKGVQVLVEDRGIGIPEQAIGRIFERFYRVDSARSREAGGTGLGLSIVKHLVEAHGGSVECQSQPGEGSVFSFTLPLSS
jgi:two-component system phosphate regulon sensor histidine kinase PhoR